MANWPSTLPQSLLTAGLSRKHQPAKLRSKMDSGPAKQRTRFTAAVKMFDSTLILTGAQLTIFYNFYETTLGQGADSFTWKDPFTDVACDLRFMDEPDDVMIAGNVDPTKRLFRVSLPLEKMP